MFAWFTADSGTFDCQAQFALKTSLSEFSGLSSGSGNQMLMS